MKKIIIIWTFIAVILISALTIIGFKIKQKNAPYTKLEKEIENSAIALIGKDPTYLQNNDTITIDELINQGYNINKNINNDKCDGYVKIEKNMNFYKYKPYIKCEKYQTNGYK